MVYVTYFSPDVWTNAWNGIERTSGKHWKESPDDAMVPAMSDPFQACTIVTGGGEESSFIGGGRAGTNAFGIDVWR